MTQESTRRSPRAPLELEVRIRYPDVDELVRECSRDISLGGMFIRSDAPPGVGERFRFAIDVGDEATVVAGDAEVVWTRTAAEGPDRPAGMGIRFVGMDEVTRRIVFQIVDRFIQEHDGEPFDVDRDR